MITLDPFQVDALNAIWEEYHLGGINRPVVQLPTGAGKTIVAGAFSDSYLRERPSGRFLFLAHRAKLLTQARDEFADVMPQYRDQMGIVQGNFDSPSKRFVFASWATLNQPSRLRRYTNYGLPDLIVTDEAHHVPSLTYLRTLEELNRPDTFTLGITATPFRSDGISLAVYFQKLVYSISTLELIQLGYLVDVRRILVQTDIDLASVPKGENGDYQQKALEAAVAASDNRYELVIQAIQQHAPGKPGICFAASVQDAKLFAVAANEAGIRTAVIVDSTPETPQKRRRPDELDRETIFAMYERGELDWLASFNVLLEGFNSPRAEVVLWLCHTASPGKYIQGVGRGLRTLKHERHLPYELRTKKECLVLEAAGNDHMMVALPVLVGTTEREIGTRSVRELLRDKKINPIPREEDEDQAIGYRAHIRRDLNLFTNQTWTRTRSGDYSLAVPGIGKAELLYYLTGYQVRFTSEGGQVRLVTNELIANREHAMGMGELHIQTIQARRDLEQQRRVDPKARGERVAFSEYKWMLGKCAAPRPPKVWTQGQYQDRKDELKRADLWWKETYPNEPKPKKGTWWDSPWGEWARKKPKKAKKEAK